MSKRKSSGEQVAREFPNDFPDYSNELLLDSAGKLEAGLAVKLHSGIDELLAELETFYSSQVDWRDGTVYTGTTGVALMYIQLHRRLHSATGTGETGSRYLTAAKHYIDRALERSREKGVTFLCGEAGPLAVGTVLYRLIGQLDKSIDCFNRLLRLSEHVLADRSLPHELLYGRVGYLFSLLFVKQELPDCNIDAKLTTKILRDVIDAGRSLADREMKEAGLMFEWHGSKYLGAAHGLIGILYILLQFSNELTQADLMLVRHAVDYLGKLRYPSGNYPSSMDSEGGDRLVHWCHGAPGWIYLFLEAHKVFKDSSYLDAAKGCGEVIWTRGLLRKGCGICHGVAGNAYGLLALYRTTQDKKYLYRAYKFALWCCDYHGHGCRTPDRPYSLFEGMAGTIYFLVDMLQPNDAKFPAFEL